MAEYLAEFRGISKSFSTTSGAFRALDNISFGIKQGSIHALVGENGAGKSTLMKILFGPYPPSEGSVFFENREVNWSSALQAQRSGIGMVHQHFMLAESETALDNVLLHSLDMFSRFGVLQREKLLKHLDQLSEKTGLRVNWTKTVSQLSVGEQQRLEIIKALIRPTKLLILDEPTAVLTPNEITGFLDKLKELRNQGVTILIITHKLKEVLYCADQATVIRGGKLVGSKPIAELSEDLLAQMMIGHQTLPLRSSEPTEQKPVIKISEQVFLKSGEILGIAGVEGNGQNELMLNLINANWGDLKVSAMPPDRLRQAMAGEMSLLENILLSPLHRKRFSKGILWKMTDLISYAKKIVSDFDVRPNNIMTSIGDFSGGNQQKFVAAREMDVGEKIDVIFISHPTRGVDLGASQFIRDQILKLRNSGVAVLLLSSDVHELLSLADRLVVMSKGTIKGPFKTDSLDESKLGLLMGGSDAN